MFQELKFVFEKNARIKRYDFPDKFYACKMEENNAVNEHILRMCGYYNCLVELVVEPPMSSSSLKFSCMRKEIF